jgi:hypothetical protein
MTAFICSLAHDGTTVDGAAELIAELRRTGLRHVGIKDAGPPPAVLREVADAAHAAGMDVMLEIAAGGAKAELRALHSAHQIGADWILGGRQVQAAEALLRGSGIRYLPFAGRPAEHTGMLAGGIDEIARDAAELTARNGVHGVTLPAYRHPNVDPVSLARAVVAAADGPVVVAGAITRLGQVAALRSAGVWGFSIGSAIFERRLPGGPSITGQVAAVLGANARMAIAAP